jgi:hypothetical protein
MPLSVGHPTGREHARYLPVIESTTLGEVGVGTPKIVEAFLLLLIPSDKRVTHPVS